MQSIAVWNTAFLGDAVLTLPLLRLLHAAWPEARLDFYVRGGLMELFSAQPEISNVYAYDKRKTDKGLVGVKKIAGEIFARRYSIWINAHSSPRSAVLALASRAGMRIGYTESALSSVVLTDRLNRRFGELHEVDRLLQLALPLRPPRELWQDEDLLWPDVTLPFSAEIEADNFLEVLRPGPVLGIHPGSVWPTKCWLLKGFAKIARRALEAGANVVLLGGQEDCLKAEQIIGLLGFELAAVQGRLVNLAGKTSLAVLAAVIARMQCYLTNDSGPMHLAWAQRVPVTAVFGPTVPEFGFAPRGNSSVINAKEPCSPCGKHGHKVCPKKHFNCMKNVDPDQVWLDVESKLYPWKKMAAERYELLRTWRVEE